jgi:hypothetical protein
MALGAVGEQRPPEQFMFWVGAEEITTSACAAVAADAAAAIRPRRIDRFARMIGVPLPG